MPLCSHPQSPRKPSGIESSLLDMALPLAVAVAVLSEGPHRLPLVRPSGRAHKMKRPGGLCLGCAVDIVSLLRQQALYI